MPIERLRVRHLSPEERADLESALTDPGRFHAEDRKPFVLGLVGVGWLLFLAEVAIMLECRQCPWEFGEASQLFEGFFSSLPWSLQFLWHPEVLPLVGSNVVLMAIVAILAMLLRIWLSRKRQGHALTSFGVVRVRGNSLRLLRYAEIAETRVGQLRHGVLDVLDTGGNSLVVDGGAEWKPLIDARCPIRRAADTDGKRSA